MKPTADATASTVVEPMAVDIPHYPVVQHLVSDYLLGPEALLMAFPHAHHLQPRTTALESDITTVLATGRGIGTTGNETGIVTGNLPEEEGPDLEVDQMSTHTFHHISTSA